MIEVSQRGDVAILTMVHGKANALNTAFCDALAARVQEATAARAIIHRTRGHSGGPITRLASPGDLGQLIKPFVFLDLFDFNGADAPSMEHGWHPHSGIATVTVVLGGAIRYIPRKPDLADTSVTVRGSTFSVNESDSIGWRGGATFNVPFGDNFAFRASVEQYDDPGFIDTPYLVREPGISDPEPDLTNPNAVAANLYREDDADWEETTYARVGLRWQPGDNCFLLRIRQASTAFTFGMKALQKRKASPVQSERSCAVPCAAAGAAAKISTADTARTAGTAAIRIAFILNPPQ